MFVELLAPIGSALNRFSEGNRMLDSMMKSNELAEKKLEQGDKRLEMRKRELDLMEQWTKDSKQSANNMIQQYGNHITPQTPSMRDQFEQIQELSSYVQIPPQ